MWAQNTELKGAARSGEGGKDRAQGVFPMGARGKDNRTEQRREGKVKGVKAGSGYADW